MFEYLNHANRWPRLKSLGLEIDPEMGTLSLRRLPGPPRAIGCLPGVSDPTPDATGMAIGPNGFIYISNVQDNRIYVVDPLAQRSMPLACIGGKGWEVGQVDRPLGLLVQRCRNRLLIADSSNHRIQVVDPETGQIVGIWGQTWPYSSPKPCFAEGGLDGPEQLAEDSKGGIYVVDRSPGRSPGRVVKLNADGLRDIRFSETVAATFASDPNAKGFDPRYVAVSLWSDPGTKEQIDRLFVLGSVPSPNVGGQPNADLWMWVLSTDGRSIINGARTLFSLTSDDPANSDRRAAAIVNSPSRASPTDICNRLRGFTAIGTMAFVGISGSITGPKGSRVPDRVWCFEIKEAFTTSDLNAIEPSWLPLYSGTIAALGSRGQGTEAELLIYPGPGLDIMALPVGGSYRTQGAFLAGPFPGARGQVSSWQRIRFTGKLPSGCRAQFFTLSRNEADNLWKPPVRPRLDRLPRWFQIELYADLFSRLKFSPVTEPDPSTPQVREANLYRKQGEATPSADTSLTPPGSWFVSADGQLDFMVQNSGGTVQEPADQFWILGLLAGTGSTSPELVQGRLSYNDDGWLNDLPNCYKRDPRSRTLLRSMLGLFESLFEDATESIDRLPGMFSPHLMASLYGINSKEMSWLAQCLALSLPPRKVPPQQLVSLFEFGPIWLSQRGTPDGLRKLIQVETGVEVHLDEPGVLDVPLLAGDSTFGAVNSLGSASTDGPVLGRDVLGQAVLRDPDGPPSLPSDLAHHFVVRGYEVDLWCEERLAAVTTAVKNAAPAHTTWSVQVIKPLLTVGVQARLGIDAVVAAFTPTDPLTLGLPPGSDTQIALVPTTAPTVGAAHLGADTRLQ